VLDQLKVDANTRLLITGASGVTASIAVQLAAQIGAIVVAIGAARHAERLRRLRAAEVIDSRAADWAESVEGSFDAALVAVNGTAVTLVRDGGRLCSITSHAPRSVRDIESRGLYVRPDAAQLAYLATLCADGRLKLIASPVALEEGPSTVERVAAGNSGGTKYVLTF
jgi:NADPH:quinone reductase-like Zn-dependent oxidoreductase